MPKRPPTQIVLHAHHISIAHHQVGPPIAIHIDRNHLVEISRRRHHHRRGIRPIALAIPDVDRVRRRRRRMRMVRARYCHTPLITSGIPIPIQVRRDHRRLHHSRNLRRSRQVPNRQRLQAMHSPAPSSVSPSHVNVPSPFPCSNSACAAATLTTASRFPDPLKSPSAPLSAGLPAANARELLNPPSALPNKIATPSGESTATSGTPSPLKSATAKLAPPRPRVVDSLQRQA